MINDDMKPCIIVTKLCILLTVAIFPFIMYFMTNRTNG